MGEGSPDRSCQAIEISNAPDYRLRKTLPTTRWTLIRRASLDRCPYALSDLVHACWYPLYVWARRQQISAEDAEDAVQAFLAKLVTQDRISQADPQRGKFRSWLLAGFENHLRTERARNHRQKRGSGTSLISLDGVAAEELYLSEIPSSIPADHAYDRAWALAILDEALHRLQRHTLEGTQPHLFEVLLPCLDSAYPDSTFQEQAVPLKMKPDALRQAAVRFRKRYRQFLIEVASERLGITSEARLLVELKRILEE
jgi:DNA-directed RNA polymerase specialized sigma24 family protein